MALLDFISSSTNSIITSIGSIIDDLVTTDEERKELKNKFARIMNSHKLKLLQAQNDYEKELTYRLKADTTSDSWLAKNIRPLSLGFLLVAIVGLAYTSVFILNNETNNNLLEWIDLFKSLLITIVTFYFGSRGFEKVQKIKNKNFQ